MEMTVNLVLSVSACVVVLQTSSQLLITVQNVKINIEIQYPQENTVHFIVQSELESTMYISKSLVVFDLFNFSF